MKDTQPKAGGEACAGFLAHHSDYLDGELEGEAREAHERHRDACTECGRYARVLKRGVSLLREQPRVLPSEDFASRLQHRLYHIDDAAVLPRRRVLPAALIAAGLALVVLTPRLREVAFGSEETWLGAHLHEEVFAPGPPLWRMTSVPLAPTTLEQPVAQPVALFTPVMVHAPRYLGSGALD